MELVLPAVVALGVAVLAGLVPLPLRPDVAVPVLTILTGVAGGLVIIMLTVVSIGFVGGQSVVSALLESCPAVPIHHRVDWTVGVPALVGLVVATARIRHVVRDRRRAIAATQGRRVAIVEEATPVAFAAPGSPGCVVISSGLLGMLAPRERQVVFAHERAHLDQGHHRYLLVAALSTAVMPLLRPVADRIRHATERCADEAAVASMGGDRELVATAIARVALAGTANSTTAAFGGGSVPARVGALLGAQPDPARTSLGLLVAAPFSIGIIAAFTIQLHHLVELIAHVCGR